jgi:hypothetical protein
VETEEEKKVCAEAQTRREARLRKKTESLKSEV